jgi:hypothetical protein
MDRRINALSKTADRIAPIEIKEDNINEID